MTRRDRRRSPWLGLLALAAALAPGPRQDAPPPPPRDLAGQAEARVRAGQQAYDMAWLYFSENRVDSEKVYRWSHRVLEATREAATEKAGHVAACRGHLGRIEKLEAKIARIRKLGFGNSLDVVEVDYYRKEAELWLARAAE